MKQAFEEIRAKECVKKITEIQRKRDQQLVDTVIRKNNRPGSENS